MTGAQGSVGADFHVSTAGSKAGMHGNGRRHNVSPRVDGQRLELGCNAYLSCAFRAREATVSLACSNLVVRDGGCCQVGYAMVG